MRKLIFLALALIAVAVGAYLYFFKRAETVRLTKGYKDADTPQVAADMFKRAIEKREYDIAAHYCTAGFGEQLKRGNAAAAELGEALDNLVYQMKEHGVMRDEVKVVLHSLDPFPKEVQITVSKESGDYAEAAFAFDVPYYAGNQPSSGSWNLKDEIRQVFPRSAKMVSVNKLAVAMKKEKEGWKFDFPADANLQLRVGYLNDKYKNYVNPIRTVTAEIKNDPATKENVTNRLKSLLEQAAKE